MAMRLYKYRVTVRHDKGKMVLVTAASSLEGLKRIVCACEGCPERAIVKIVMVKRLV